MTNTKSKETEMKIENEHGSIEWKDIDQTEEGFESIEGVLIDSIQIHLESRNQGHGRELLRDALAQIDGPVYLVACPKDIDTDFGRLVEFYASEGFQADESAADMPWPLMYR
jgi:GNAT superfamily N-acetyltransferase